MAVTAAQVAAARRSVGLQADSDSDEIWASRPWATIQDVTSRLRERRAEVDAEVASTGGTYLGVPSRTYSGAPAPSESTNAHEDAQAQADAERERGNPTTREDAQAAEAERAAAAEAEAAALVEEPVETPEEVQARLQAEEDARIKANRRSFADQAAVLYPWMDKTLLDFFTEAYVSSGDVSLAVGEVRNGTGAKHYDTIFAGNRRDDGSLRHDEQTYMGILDGYAGAVERRGLDPQLFAGAGTWARGIENGWSALEFEAGVAGIEDSIFQHGDNIIKAFSQASGGIAFTREAALTAMIDENLGNELFQRKISIAQVRGTAKSFGHTRSLDRGDDLHNAGVNMRTATDFYSKVNQNLGFLDPAAKRFGEQDDTFDVAELEDATLLSDPLERARMARLVGRGYGEFGRSSSFAGQGNKLTGLRDR